MTEQPFSEVFRPAAREALAGIEAPVAVCSAFAAYLERRFSAVLAQAVYLRFSAHRIGARAFHGSSAGCYASFVREAADEGLEALVRNLPLAREALALLRQQARSFLRDFTRHFREDRAAIAKLLGCTVPAEIARVQVGLSDPHHGGRTVVQITLADSRQLYYKPRSLAVDVEWASGVAEIGRHLPLSLRAAAVADCRDHGWAEAIVENVHMTRREAEAFYWRYGALLGLGWLLDAVDLHRDNVIVSGEHPVLVDLESLLHPLEHGEERTLERTGILPTLGADLDASAFSGAGLHPGLPARVWQAVGTDDPYWSWRSTPISDEKCLPRVDGSRLLPHAAAREIQDGFARLVKEAREVGPWFEQWRWRLSATPRRHIIRPTELYTRLLVELTHPRYLQTREFTSAALIAWQKQEEFNETTLAEERAQITAWDIPALMAPSRPGAECPLGEAAARRAELALALKRQPQTGLEMA